MGIFELKNQLGDYVLHKYHHMQCMMLLPLSLCQVADEQVNIIIFELSIDKLIYLPSNNGLVGFCE